MEEKKLSIECILQMLTVDDIGLLKKRLMENEYIYYIFEEIDKNWPSEIIWHMDSNVKRITANNKREAMWEIFNNDVDMIYPFTDLLDENIRMEILKLIKDHYDIEIEDLDDEDLDWVEVFHDYLVKKETIEIIKQYFTKDEIMQILNRRSNMFLFLIKADKLWQ